VGGLGAGELGAAPARGKVADALEALLGPRVRASLLSTGAAALGPRRRLLNRRAARPRSERRG
jgi:hypothetical protein